MPSKMLCRPCEALLFNILGASKIIWIYFFLLNWKWKWRDQMTFQEQSFFTVILQRRWSLKLLKVPRKTPVAESVFSKVVSFKLNETRNRLCRVYFPRKFVNLGKTNFKAPFRSCFWLSFFYLGIKHHVTRFAHEKPQRKMVKKFGANKNENKTQDDEEHNNKRRNIEEVSLCCLSTDNPLRKRILNFIRWRYFHQFLFPRCNGAFWFRLGF